MVDIATRVHNHNWRIDPIVRSLIDTDFYKLLMCQSIFRNKPDTVVQFSLINRQLTKKNVSDVIDAVYRHCGQKECVIFADRLMGLDQFRQRCLQATAGVDVL